MAILLFRSGATSGPGAEGRTVFVDRLDPSTTPDDLFRYFGTQDRIEGITYYKDRNKYYAFIAFKYPRDATAAVLKDKSHLRNAIITVRWAQEVGNPRRSIHEISYPADQLEGIRRSSAFGAPAQFQPASVHSTSQHPAQPTNQSVLSYYATTGAAFANYNLEMRETNQPTPSINPPRETAPDLPANRPGQLPTNILSIMRYALDKGTMRCLSSDQMQELIDYAMIEKTAISEIERMKALEKSPVASQKEGRLAPEVSPVQARSSPERRVEPDEDPDDQQVQEPPAKKKIPNEKLQSYLDKIRQSKSV